MSRKPPRDHLDRAIRNVQIATVLAAIAVVLTVARLVVLLTR